MDMGASRAIVGVLGPAQHAAGDWREIIPMSTIDAELEVPQSPAGLSAGPGTGDLALTSAREARVGDVTVRRLLPLRQRRSVGAWCFVDHYGPMSVDGMAGMRVPPHPHIGLQTVTWLISGNVLHRDSLGSEQMIRPGQLNLMTSGRGIAHSEESAVEHHAELPTFGVGGLSVTVFLGSLAGARSPATAYSEIIGAEIVARRGAADWDAADWAVAGHAAGGPDASGRIAVTPSHEHVVFVSAGSADVEGTVLRTGQLLYLGTGREQLTMAAAAGSRLFLLGGVPLGEPLLMWWNFVARTPEEITAAAGEWASGRFGTVNGYDGEPLAAPPLDAVRLTRPR